MDATGMSFGERLRFLREKAGLTQEELAEQAGLTAQGIGALERGDRRHPYRHTVRAIADALGLSTDEHAALAALVARRATSGVIAEPASNPPGGEMNVSPPLSGLLASPTALVGRHQELDEIVRLLTSTVRLVTLTGPGGVGKTTLALETARRAASAFPDGVHVVPLAPIGDPALVTGTLVHTLGLTQVSGQPAGDLLRAHLRDKHVLLLLDNFEHLLGAAADLAALLAECPRLVVLATSRAPLRVRGEQEYPVGPLAVPNLNRIPLAAELSGVPSVALFVERARAGAPRFELTQANVAAVAAICRRLAGLPLAIELAAVRVRLLTPTELLARLDRALPLLAGGARDLPERQRTMRAAIGWSYDLLANAEQALFRRLSVFPGGCTLEAVEAVCAEPSRFPASQRRDEETARAGNGVVAAEEVLDLLMTLVEQSLVVAEETASGETRYRMLEPIRQYARELLDESGEARAVSLAHAGYFLALAEQAHRHIDGHQQTEWIERLEVENDNLRAAIGWCLDEGDVLDAIRFGKAIRMYWVIHGRHGEGRRWMQQALARGDDLPAASRADALYALGVCVYGSGENQWLLEITEESASLYRQTDDRYGEALALGLMGFACILVGDIDRAEKVTREGLAILESMADRWASAHLYTHMAVISLRRGDLARAVEHAKAALARTRETGDRLATYVAQLILGQTAQAQGNHDDAIRQYKAGLMLAAEVTDRANAAFCVRGLAGVAVAMGQPERGACLFGAAEALLDATGNPAYAYIPDPILHERAAEAAREQLGELAWAAAWQRGRAMTLEQAVAESLAAGETQA
jgi:predicted ATPase/DNA-binding XRE family transcriptional regulator